MSSGSRGEAGENQEFVQIGVLEAEFDKCRKQLFSQLRKAHGRIADLDKEVNKKTDIIVDLKREITEQKDNFAKNIASKEEKLRILSVEMNEKHKINNMLKKENDTLQENSKKEIRYLQNLNIEHKKNIERLNDHIKKMNIDMKNLSSKHRKETEQLEYDLNETKHAFTCKENEIKVRSTELEYQIETLETEKRKLGEIVKTQNTEVKNLKSTQKQLEQRELENESYKTLLHEHIKEMEKEINQQQDKITKQKVKITEQEEELKKQKGEIKKLKGHLKQIETLKQKNENASESEIKALTRKIEVLTAHIREIECKYNTEIKHLIRDNQVEQQNLMSLSRQNKEVIQRLQTTQGEVHSLTEEKKELLLRLSKLAGANLTYNNPNIADLSDEKRPTKLAEEFLELYDNEWTGVFEELDFETEREKTNFLLDILMKTNAICMDLSNDHTKRIKDAFCRLTTSHDTLANAVKRSRIEKKEAKPANLQNEEHFESLNKEISVESDFDLLHKNQKKTIVEAKNFFEINLSKEVETTVTKLIIGELRQKGMEMYDHLERYIAKCVNICWSMCRHSPPLFIEFPDVKENTPFDTNKYKPYTFSGKFIDYIVWPVLFLHEEGPCLCKGVAQGRSNKETK